MAVPFSQVPQQGDENSQFRNVAAVSTMKAFCVGISSEELLSSITDRLGASLHRDSCWRPTRVC